MVLVMNQLCFANEIKIVTLNSPEQEILKKKTEDIQPGELKLAREITEKLYAALKPYGAVAGLAAPQIGISKSVFIYSYDRNPDHLEAVINPTLKPTCSEVIYGWEGCLSVVFGDIWKLAYVPRYKQIDVVYLNLDGEQIQKRLSGFAAKVFQHEFDHLQGVECIHRHDASVREFPNKETLMSFLQKVKEDDARHYHNPKD